MLMIQMYLYHRWECLFVCLFDGVWRYFQQYFNYIVEVSFIAGGNRRTRRKPPTCRKSLTYEVQLHPLKSNGAIRKILQLTAIFIILFFIIKWNRKYHIVWYLDLQLPMQSVPITTDVLSHDVVHFTLIEVRTQNISGDRHWLHR
jgi:hypothetical protein